LDLRLSPEQQQLRDASRRLLAERLASLVERLPAPPLHDPVQALADATALGWVGLGLPESFGGAGSFEDLAIVHEELGRGLAPSIATTLGIAGRLLVHLEPTPARDQLLRELCEGSTVVVAATNPGIRVRKGALEGSQRHVVDARVASWFLVAARDDAGIDQMVLLDAASVALEDERGMADVEQCRLSLDGVRIRDRLLSTDATGALDAVRTEATVLAAARSVGGGRAVLARTLDHVRTRHQFDRPIGTFQAVQHQLADVAMALDAAGLAVTRTVWAVMAGSDQAEGAAALAGLAASDAFADATLVAHQLHGGMGFVLDSPLHLWSARAVADPTTPRSRRRLLAVLASALGLSDNTVRLAPDHRAPAGDRVPS
jgi:alkylation response protein AidB-like acyl-CoA dehydrogenase